MTPICWKRHHSGEVLLYLFFIFLLSVAVSTSLPTESLIIQPWAILNKGTIISSSKGLSDMPCSRRAAGGEGDGEIS